MTVKRFTYVKNNSITQYQSLPIQEIGKSKALHCQGVVDKLNKLSDENEQLKSKNRGLQSELQIFKEDVTHSNFMINKLRDENRQLKQFKEDVFAKIDMHLRMLPTARDNEFNEEDGDPSLYSGAIYMLETLKKEIG